MRMKLSVLPRFWRASTLAAVMATLALPAAAQYKVVGPDGRVTYTDRPPADAASKVTTLSRGAVSEVPATQDTLPAELRQVATRYPVTLYSTADCATCESGRQLLKQRGVPFTEKLIISEDDVVAMERVVGVRTVPTLTIGAQAVRGMSESEWAGYLDAAGYPRESKLPKNWQHRPATPLVQRSNPLAAPSPLAAASAPLRNPPMPEVPVLPQAPAGIRF
jgi:glutaredoxin